VAHFGPGKGFEIGWNRAESGIDGIRDSGNSRLALRDTHTPRTAFLLAHSRRRLMTTMTSMSTTSSSAADGNSGIVFEPPIAT